MESRDLWVGRFQLDGKRHAVYARTMKECQRKMREAHRLAESGVTTAPAAMTTGRYLDEWLETSVRGRLRPATVKSYEDTVRLFLKPALGRVPLVKLEARHIERMLADLPAHLSDTTRRYCYVILRIALGRAYKQGLVLRNVATMVDAPSKAKHDVEPFSQDEVSRFLASIEDDRLQALYVVALATGMRQGELLGLRWVDVDLAEGTVTIRHTMSRIGAGLGEPKTEASKRTVRLPASALAVLRRHKADQKVVKLGEGYVFATRTGTALQARNVSRSYHRALERAGIEHRRFHDLRHTFATLLLGKGVDVAVVSKALGHSNVSTTADVYAHWTRPMQERTAAVMETVLTGT
jgi:integrase